MCVSASAISDILLKIHSLMLNIVTNKMDTSRKKMKSAVTEARDVRVEEKYT